MSALTFDIDNYATPEEAYAAFYANFCRTHEAINEKFGELIICDVASKFCQLQRAETEKRGGFLSGEALAAWSESLFKKGE